LFFNSKVKNGYLLYLPNQKVKILNSPLSPKPKGDISFSKVKNGYLLYLPNQKEISPIQK
jgi:hypothetical protein